MTVAGSAIKLFTLSEVCIFITGLHFKKHKICMIMLFCFRQYLPNNYKLWQIAIYIFTSV